jgi:diacylglycerol kinase (ATP)
MIRAELIRLWKAWGYSRDGLIAATREDAPFRLEVVLSVVILPLGVWWGHTGIERALLIGSWLLVPAIELLNCGFEAITDYATKNERHALAKKTKDVGSAAVFVAIVNFLAVWILILA